MSLPPFAYLLAAPKTSNEHNEWSRRTYESPGLLKDGVSTIEPESIFIDNNKLSYRVMCSRRYSCAYPACIGRHQPMTGDTARNMAKTKADRLRQERLRIEPYLPIIMSDYSYEPTACVKTHLPPIKGAAPSPRAASPDSVLSLPLALADMHTPLPPPTPPTRPFSAESPQKRAPSRSYFRERRVPTPDTISVAASDPA